MLEFALKRFALAALILVVAVTIMFLMIRAVPGDPVSIMLGPRATPELKERLIAEMALDNPFLNSSSCFSAACCVAILGSTYSRGARSRQSCLNNCPTR